MSWTGARLMFAAMNAGRQMTSTQKCVLLAVVTLASAGDWSPEHIAVAASLGLDPGDVGVCLASASQLAELAACDSRTARRYLDGLAADGLLVKVHMGAGLPAAWVLMDEKIAELAKGNPGRQARTPRASGPHPPGVRSRVSDDTPDLTPGAPRISDPTLPGSEARGSRPRGTHAKDARVPRALDLPPCPLAPDPPTPPAQVHDLEVVADGSPVSQPPSPAQVEAPARDHLTAAVVDAPPIPDLSEPSGRRFGDAWTQAERRHQERQAGLRASQLVNAARASVDELVAGGATHSPLVSALSRLAVDVEDVQTAWRGQGSVEPQQLLDTLDEHGPLVAEAVALHLGHDDPPPPAHWPRLVPQLARVQLAVSDTQQDLTPTTETAA